jgi:SAM-dependent methyltransferase
MSDEMTKSHRCRLRHGDYTWFKGDILDVGCGNDPIKLDPPSTVRGWDLEDGDAQLLEGVKDGSFDVVCASHCLEHMHDPAEALCNWSRVLREGGHMYILVPLFSAYEKFNDFAHGGDNPSRFNADHKTSWDLVSPVMRPVNHEHYDYPRIVILGRQAGLTLTDLRMELDGYHWEKMLDQTWDSTQHGGMAQLCMIFAKI